MKQKIYLVSLAIACLLIPNFAGAATVLDETGTIVGTSWKTYSFVADQTTLDYQVTLTDFKFPAKFDFLGVAITASNVMVAHLLEPGTTTFSVDFNNLGTTYLVNVLGIAADPHGAGLFNINIKAVPIPPSFILLGSCALGLVLLRRKVR